MFSRDGSRIFVLSGKGLTSQANPRGSQPGHPGHGRAVQRRDAAGLALGPARRRTPATLPGDDQDASTRMTPVTAATILAPAAGAGRRRPFRGRSAARRPSSTSSTSFARTAPTTRSSATSRRGNGDPNLCLFGEDVTPNAHAIAREFVVLDNFYVDAEVSYDGHAYSTGAYATDFVEKIWPTNYGGRGARYMSEGGGKMRNAYGNVTAPLNGYIWDACNARQGQRAQLRRVRAARPRARGRERRGRRARWWRRYPASRGTVHPNYPPYDLTIPDNKRVGRLARGVPAVRAVRARCRA